MAWRKGHPRSIETRQKISLGLKKAHVEGRRKPSLPKGYKWSTEALENRRQGILKAYSQGKIFGFRHHKSGFTGGNLTEESRQEISKSVKQAWEEGRLSKPPPRLKDTSPELAELWRKNLRTALEKAWAEGRRKSEMSEDVRMRLAESVHQAWLRGELHGYPHKEETKQLLSIKTKQAYIEGRLGNDPELEKRRLTASYQAQHWRPNKPERKLQNLLKQHFPGEWEYTGDGSHTIGGFPVDFTNINGKKAVIELFGDYWHNRPNLKWHQSELGRLMAYNSLGFSCLVIWEHELRDEQVVVAKVKQFMKRR